MLSTGCWQDLATKSYAKDPGTVDRVEAYRVQVANALANVDLSKTRLSLNDNVELALVVMACESGGTNAAGGSLYQITRETWEGIPTGDATPWRRDNPSANIEGMAYLVQTRGWQPWEGGPWADSPTGYWGSGPKGNKCWKFPDE